MNYRIVVDIIPDAGGADDVTHRIERKDVTLEMLRDRAAMDKEFDILSLCMHRFFKSTDEYIAEARAKFEELTGQPAP